MRAPSNTLLAFAAAAVALVAFSSTVHKQALFSKNSVREHAEAHVNDLQSVAREGDILFQELQSAQCSAVKAATKSRYSHCGILLRHRGRLMVFEATYPTVRYSDPEEWIAAGKDGHFVLKRLRGADTALGDEVLRRMREYATAQQGKRYDEVFEWGDDRMYCSELVWKIYAHGTGAEVGTVQQLRDFDLAHPAVAPVVARRYGTDIPYSQTVISPAAIFHSPLLQEVAAH